MSEDALTSVSLQRLTSLRQQMIKEGLDALLVSNPFNRHYLAQFQSTAGYLLVSRDKQIVATDFRYTEIARKSSPGWEIRKSSPELKWLDRAVRDCGAKTLGVEADDLDLVRFRQVEATQSAQIKETSGILHAIRAVKNEQELGVLQQAVQLGDAAFKKVASQIKVGQTEIEIARMYKAAALEVGADDISFPPIVGGGPHAALPHHHPTERTLQEGETIVFDCGVIYQGYCSDLTRTLVLGAIDKRVRQVHDTVFAAQSAAAEGVRSGMKCVEADALARDLIASAGYGDNFGHGLGHGVGLEIHEWPRVTPVSNDTLEDGMVFTIEPGIYINGWGGVRIEDVFVMQDGRAKMLSNAPMRQLNGVQA